MSGFVVADQLVGSRYRLAEREADQLPYEGTSLWRGTDTTLRRAVRILVLDPKSTAFPEVLDAARRCSLFDDPHAVRILSVGSDDELGWVVTEIPLGVPVSYRLNGKGSRFDEEQAKAIVGEVATILASARSRGIRHLQLSAEDVRVDSGGEVYLDGLGTKKALAGIATDHLLANEVDLIEAEGIARLYCSLLSGTTEIGPAPDCYEDMGPDSGASTWTVDFFEKERLGKGLLSPSDAIRAFAPWPRVDVDRLPYLPGQEPVEHSPEDYDPELGIVPPPPMETRPEWPSAASATMQRGSASGRGMRGDARAARPTGYSASGFAVGAAYGGDGKAGAAKADASHGPKAGVDSAGKARSGSDSSTSDAGGAKEASSKTAQAARNSLERQVDKVSFLPDDGSPRRFNTAWLFLAITLVLVGAAGMWAITLFFSLPDVDVANPGPTGPMNRDAGDLPTATETEAAPGTPNIVSATLLDPQAGNVQTSDGVSQDNPDAVANVIDDNTSTVWSSWWYPTPAYTAGKDGVGLMIELAEPVSIENVHLQVNGNGGMVQWRETSEADPAGGEVLGESPMSTATYLVPPSAQVTDTVILWFPELPTDNVDKYRLTIAEINFNKQIPEALRTAPAVAGAQGAAAR